MTENPFFGVFGGHSAEKRRSKTVRVAFSLGDAMDVSCRKAGRTVIGVQVGCLSSGANVDDGCGGLATLRSGSWYRNGVRGQIVLA